LDAIRALTLAKQLPCQRAIRKLESVAKLLFYQQKRTIEHRILFAILKS
jgi:hypothetical protein